MHCRLLWSPLAAYPWSCCLAGELFLGLSVQRPPQADALHLLLSLLCGFPCCAVGSRATVEVEFVVCLPHHPVFI